MSDADLVVFLTHFHSISDMCDSLENIFDRMKHYLITCMQGKCSYKKTTAHAVQVSLSSHAGHTLGVDILPSVNVLGTGMHVSAALAGCSLRS
jgi:hypothetical protein